MLLTNNGLDTVTVKLALPWFSAASVAVQVTVVVPTGNVAPEAGLQTGVRTPSTLSKAVAVNMTTAPDASVAGTLILLGTVTTGSVVSGGGTRSDSYDPAS